MNLLPKKKIIYGCESRGDAQSPYLTRWTLLKTPWGRLYLHRFHRSDADEMHDHPWGFWSLILWRGYVEETPCSGCKGEGFFLSSSEGHPCEMVCLECWTSGRKRKRVWPGMILRRKPEWVHRVELVEGREAWTLVLAGNYVRQWGFITSKGWQIWKDYFKERGC